MMPRFVHQHSSLRSCCLVLQGRLGRENLVQVFSSGGLRTGSKPVPAAAKKATDAASRTAKTKTAQAWFPFALTATPARVLHVLGRGSAERQRAFLGLIAALLSLQRFSHTCPVKGLIQVGHPGRFAEHSRGFADHSIKSAEHSGKSAGYSRKFAGYSRHSAEHSSQSAEHSSRSAEHSSKSAEHSSSRPGNDRFFS